MSTEVKAGEAPTGPRWKRFGSDRRGVAAIEFAMLAIPFFLTIFAVIETSFVFLAELTLDQSVERVARTLRTGEAQNASMTATAFRTALCNEVSFLLTCDKLFVDLKVYGSFADLPPPSAVKDGDLDTSGFDFKYGGPQSILALRVYYKWPIITDVMRASLSDMKDGSHLLFAMAAFQTEPY